MAADDRPIMSGGSNGGIQTAVMDNVLMSNVATRIRGLVSSKKVKKDTMFSRYFQAHGQICASRPWEVIIGTLTTIVCIMSMSFFSTNRKICGWNYICQEQEDDTKSSDVIILTLTRCLAVIYVYLQFRNLRKLGSKYLLGIAGIFTIFSSFVFSIGVINMIGTDLTGLNEALPFFLLLVDLSKACTLAKFAFSAITQDEVVENIGHGMAKLGPVLTLDAIVETLVIGVGTLSGVKTLETMCCFGCLSVVANYLAFMTFYPACLALILDLTRGSRPLLQIQKLAKAWQEEEADEEKPNPVTQRVKIIMSAGLVFVHAHGRLFVSGGASDIETAMSVNIGMPLEFSGSKVLVPDVPLWQFYASHLASLSVDYIITLFLAAILTFKYVIMDRDDLSDRNDEPPDSLSVSSDESPPSSTPRGTTEQEEEEEVMEHRELDHVDSDIRDARTNTLAVERLPVIEPLCIELDDAADSVAAAVIRKSKPSCVFKIGEDSSSEDEAEIRRAVDAETQTENVESSSSEDALTPRNEEVTTPRTNQECVAILKTEKGASQLTDAEILTLVGSKHIPPYKLEAILGDHERGVAVRRSLVSETLTNKSAMDRLPYTNYDYTYVDGACCENVIGYIPVPVGVAGPLLLDGQLYTIPMATTEGCLVASTNRGCRALSSGEGVKTSVVNDGMSRAPLVRFISAKRATEVKRWLEDRDNYDLVAEEFNSTSRFARLQRLQVVQFGRSLHVRFVAVTGDAMGMNMLSKGCEKVLNMIQEHHFPDMEIMSLSGNFCTDKKPSSVNWIEGRGKSVVAEAIVPRDTIKNTLKTTAAALVDLNINKNFVGSIAAGSIGGFNAHAANMVTAIYIATGQDPAQNICSSSCVTQMEVTGVDGEDLFISCTMPSIEVGTVGGGTILPPQAACLEMLGVRGANKTSPGENGRALARIVCATVMAGELSLMSALAAGHLVKSHLKHNRSTINMAPNTAAPNPPHSAPALPHSVTAIPSQNTPSLPHSVTAIPSQNTPSLPHSVTAIPSQNAPAVSHSVTANPPQRAPAIGHSTTTACDRPELPEPGTCFKTSS